jgi:c-di-GMP phosphodiesterase
MIDTDDKYLSQEHHKGDRLMEQSILVRQPIFDKSLDVFAYELIMHDKTCERLLSVDERQEKTAELIEAAFFGIDLATLLNKKSALIPFEANKLQEEIIRLMPKEQVIISLVGADKLTESALQLLKRLQADGYRFAVNVREPEDLKQPVCEMADFIKIENSANSLPELIEVAKSKEYAVIATMIDAYDDVDSCKETGFDFFQGSFISRPNIIEGKKIESNQTVILKILSELQSPDIEVEDIERIVCQDATLSYKLLRFINSAAFALPRKISSLREAVVRLGQAQIKRLAMLMSLTAISDKPSELTQIAMVRAKMCELISEKLNLPNSKSYFTVGLFSTLDAMLDKPLADILQELPLSDDLNQALLAHAGEMGEMLENILAYEFGNWDKIQSDSLAFDVFQEAYFKSIEWAGELGKALSS